jgi:FAD dependent oxidoreductase
VRTRQGLDGDYVLTLDDVLAGRDFPDTVARGAYPVDLHDVKAGAEELGYRVGGGGVSLRCIERAYGIPLRCLIPAGLDGVVVAGRAISATHEAGGSARGQAVCMATGHAAGVLAGLACRRGSALRDVDASEVQNVLVGQGAVLFYAESPSAGGDAGDRVTTRSERRR